MVEIIPKHGGYRNLRSYQGATVIYDLTTEFCNKYIDRKSRTTDQMIQAARSGKQNRVFQIDFFRKGFDR